MFGARAAAQRLRPGISDNWPILQRRCLSDLGGSSIPFTIGGSVSGNPLGVSFGLGEPEEKKDPLHWSRGGEKYEYDLVVIGGGSGGLAASKAASRHGATVACLDYVEPSPQGTTWGLGGTCVNVGCIPKKLMHIAAGHGEGVKDAASFGWAVPAGGSMEHNWSELVLNSQQYIKSLNFGYRTALMDNKVKYINALGTFRDAHTIECVDKGGSKKSITSDRFLVAVGGRPRLLDIPGSAEHCVTSDDIFGMREPPGRTLCIGASYVSLECAGFSTGLGFDTSVMMRSIPLRGFDQEMSGRVVEYMEDHGTRFIRGAVPTEITKLADGRLRVTYIDGEGTELSEDYDTVMQAVGRDPATSRLGLDSVGVEMSDSGHILVDNEQTSQGNIYALGDCIRPRTDVGPASMLELTPVAIQAGNALAQRLYGDGGKGDASSQMDYSYVPTTVFTPLEYGCVGMTESDANAKVGEENIEVYHTEYNPLEWALPGRDVGRCYMKVICNKADSLRILGMHVVGPNAGEQVQGFTLGIKLGATFSDLQGMVGIHPTNAESFTTLRITKSSGESPAVTGC